MNIRILICIFILANISDAYLGIYTPVRIPIPEDFIQEYIMHKTFTNCSVYDEMPKFNGDLVKDKTSEKIELLTIHHLISPDTEEIHKLTEAHSTILASPNYDSSKPFIIFSHGFKPGALPALNASFRKNIATIGAANYFIYNHTALTSVFYGIGGGTNARVAGEVLGEMFQKLYDDGVDDISCVGTSLGAHICGFAGKVFNDDGSPLLERITGIDPSGPCYYDQTSQNRLDSSDAKFVDIIHSDANAFGHPKSLGHVDFYPNGGNNMIGCMIPFVGHVKSLEFYTESITSNDFLAVQCSDWKTFESGSCANNARAIMGYSTPSDTPHGDYYLYVREKSKYALGEEGIAKTGMEFRRFL